MSSAGDEGFGNTWLLRTGDCRVGVQPTDRRRPCSLYSNNIPMMDPWVNPKWTSLCLYAPWAQGKLLLFISLISFLKEDWKSPWCTWKTKRPCAKHGRKFYPSRASYLFLGSKKQTNKKQPKISCIYFSEMPTPFETPKAFFPFFLGPTPSQPSPFQLLRDRQYHDHLGYNQLQIPKTLETPEERVYLSQWTGSTFYRKTAHPKVINWSNSDSRYSNYKWGGWSIGVTLNM